MQENRKGLTIPAYVQETLQALEKAGHQAYCVGGCVRDSLLGRVPGDWDVTTSALPDETMAVFGEKAVPTGLKHGTVTVCWPEGKVETTTFRRDGAYTDHRHPAQVTFTASLTEDLTRRDFTVNAMAADLRGTLYDPFGGRADLETGILRCVGQPERRFSEDALRILRCLRFASVLGFAIEPATGAALTDCRELLRDIAPERICEELTKLLCGPDAAAVLRALNRHFDSPLSILALAELGARVGSDVPFCVVGGTAMVEGRGERLRKLPDMPECVFVVCKPEFSVSTPELYQKLDTVVIPLHPDNRAMETALLAGDLNKIADNVYNVFDPVVTADHLELNYIKSICNSYGSLGQQMTGSGSAVFAIMPSFEYGAVVCNMLKENYSEIFLAKPV